MRVLLVVAQQDIETRLVFFYQVRFQYQRFDLVIDDDVFQIGDAGDEFACFVVLILRALKILADAVAQALGLADVDDLALVVFIQVHAG